ncbi:MAG: site-specific integrase [Methylococcaceae bacterium]
MSYIRSLPSGKYRAEVSKNYTSIQSKTFPTESQAKKWAADVEKNIETILSLKPKKIKKISPDKVEELGGLALFQKLGVEVDFLTFKSLVNQYMKQWTGKDENYIRRANFWLTEFNDKPVKSISPKHIEKVLEKYGAGKIKGYGSNKPKSNNTLLRMKAVLSSVFQYGIEKKYLDKNPADKIRIKAEPNQIERFLSDDERVRLLDACCESSWNKMHLLILLAITTGMRKSELTNLRWTDIDFDRGLASLADTKNGSPRVNPIPSVALEELKKYRQVGNGLIFVSLSNSEKSFDFRVQWDNVKDVAKIEGFRFHDLRHTAASYLVMAGATLHETAEILGHKSTETTKRYAHLSTNHKSALAERVMDKIFRK